MNWGIIGTGGIARAFADAINEMPDATLLGVGSRSQASADKFGDQYHIPRRYPTYDALAADPDIEVIYIATPHTLHYENTLLCLDAGKHVLCEKPMALNRDQVQAMIAAAQHNQRFLMEAMWSWFIPAVVRAKELVTEGAIGTPQMLLADFGFAGDFDPHSRLFDPALGGGALLDLGIYPLAISLFIFGKPTTVSGKVVIGQTGVDEQIAMTLEYDDGKIANLVASLRANLPCEASISGTKGHVRLHRNFWHSEKLSTRIGEVEETIEMPLQGSGYGYEAREVMAQIRAGKLQSDIMPWQASLDLAEMMDTLRAQWGLTYPQEQ